MRRLSIFDKQTSETRRRPIVASSLELSYSSGSSERELSPGISGKVTTRLFTLARNVETLGDVFDLVLNRYRVLTSQDFEDAVAICLETGELIYSEGQYRSIRTHENDSSSRTVSHARYALGQLFLHGYGRYSCQNTGDLCGLFCYSSNCFTEKYHGKRLFELSNVQGRSHYGSNMMLISIHSAEFVHTLSRLFETDSPSDTRNYVVSGCYRTSLSDRDRISLDKWFHRSANLNAITCYIRGLLFRHNGETGLSRHPYYRELWNSYHSSRCKGYEGEYSFTYSERDLILCQEAINLLLTIHRKLCEDICSPTKPCSHSKGIGKLSLLHSIIANINIC